MTHKTRLIHWLMEMRMMGKDKTPVLVLPPCLYHPGIVVEAEAYCPGEAAFLIVPGGVHYFSYLGKNLADLAGSAERAGGRFDLALVSQLAEFRAMNESMDGPYVRALERQLAELKAINESRERLLKEYDRGESGGELVRKDYALMGVEKPRGLPLVEKEPAGVMQLASLVGAAKITCEAWRQYGWNGDYLRDAVRCLDAAVSPFLDEQDEHDLVAPLAREMTMVNEQELVRLRRVEAAAMAFTDHDYEVAMGSRSAGEVERLRKAIAGWGS